MPSIDLGYPQPEHDKPFSPEGKKKKKEEPVTYYPEATIRGDAAKTLMRQGCMTGDEITLTVRCKITGTQNREKTESRPYMMDEGCSIELSLRTIDEIERSEGAEEQEESAEDAIDSYRAGKSKGGDDDEE